jgi:hypothetical protein
LPLNRSDFFPNFICLAVRVLRQSVSGVLHCLKNIAMSFSERNDYLVSSNQSIFVRLHHASLRIPYSRNNFPVLCLRGSLHLHNVLVGTPRQNPPGSCLYTEQCLRLVYMPVPHHQPSHFPNQTFKTLLPDLASFSQYHHTAPSAYYTKKFHPPPKCHHQPLQAVHSNSPL